MEAKTKKVDKKRRSGEVTASHGEQNAGQRGEEDREGGGEEIIIAAEARVLLCNDFVITC